MGGGGGGVVVDVERVIGVDGGGKETGGRSEGALEGKRKEGRRPRPGSCGGLEVEVDSVEEVEDFARRIARSLFVRDWEEEASRRG